MKYIGIDLGGTQTKAGVVENGVILAEASCPTPVKDGYGAVIAAITALANQLLLLHPDVTSLGIGSPGLINISEGIVCYSNNFGFENKPLCHDLTTVFSLKTYIANDAHCAALAEAVYGAGQSYNRIAMLTIGTGVGGGFVCNKRLEEDLYGSTAYIFGHMAMALDGKHCNCGRRGCIEAYASAGAIQNKSRSLFKKDTAVKDIFDAARNKDELCTTILNEFIDYLAEGAVNLANILRPQIIVIGGGVSASCDMFLPKINKRLEKGVYGFKYAPVYAVKAQLENHAGIIGAAQLCVEKA